MHVSSSGFFAVAAAFPDGAVVEDARMDELHDKMQEVKAIVDGYATYKESLFTTFDKLVDELERVFVLRRGQILLG